jgi:hypothetical protein
MSTHPSIHPSVVDFFGRFPEAQATYVDTPLYHLTHSHYLPGIQTEGLRPNRELFPQEHGGFLLQVLRRYGSGHPSDADYVRNRILEPNNVYLSAVKPDMDGSLGYGIPERLMLLMRGMNTLATKSSLTDGERGFAAKAYDEHLRALKAGEPSIVALEVNPLAPDVVNNRLGRMALYRIGDSETALLAVSGDTYYGNNIAIDGAIAPEHISVFGQRPLDTTVLEQRVSAEASWASSIQ